ncbi:MAG: MFS transporter [Bacteroidales bacterium]|nr:MFS transporter [Bacteroidales bacterium]
MEQKSSKKWLIALLFTGVLMGALDISIVGPAIPSIETTISIEPRMLGWIFSIYILFNLIGISLFAKLSDIFGRKIIYVVAVSIFALGSIVVSFSNDFTVLLIGRSIQGFGASGFLPVASAVVGDVFPPEKRGRILGLIGAVFGIAFIIGPVIAGVLLHYFSWHSLFLINIPIAIIIILGSFKILPNTKSLEYTFFDWKGIITIGLTLGSFAYGVNNIDSENLAQSILSIHVFPFVVFSIILFFISIYIERKAPAPIIKLSFFRNKEIRIVGIIAFTTGLVQSSFVFIPTFATGVFDVEPAAASFMLLPIVIATAIGAPVFGRLIDSYGSKIVVITGIILTFVGFYLLYRVIDSKFLFYFSGVFIGLGLSVLSGSSLRYIMLNEVPATDRAVTQGMLTIFISLGQIVGAAAIGVVVSEFGQVNGYKNTFLYLVVILVVITFVALRLKNKEQEKQLLEQNINK